MAGIGFELKKLFQKKGILNTAKAYGYTAVICTGPMLLGVLLLYGINSICGGFGVDAHTREFLICQITYALLASVTVSSFFSLAVTRYTADMLYEENYEAVIPCFWGATVVMMAVGSVLYGGFLCISGVSFFQGFLGFTLFNELLVVWNAMSFLSAIKDYRGIFLSFFVSVAVTLILGLVLLQLQFPPIEAMLLAVNVGYGVMLIWDIILLQRYFPDLASGAFAFLQWLDSLMPLCLTGLFLNIGMFVHLVIMWFSDIGVQVQGLFYGAPWHDVSALLAYTTTFMTTVNFVVSVEVNFYPKYYNHYSLYNDKGTINDILQSEKEMLDTLKVEVFYTALKQLLFSTACISLGGYLLDLLPLGFNEIMRGYFRTLCVAYGLYAIGNMLLLLLLYFMDYKGACIASGMFAGCTTVFTVISLQFSNIYYGFGFLLAAMAFAVVAAVRLDYFTKKLPYYILSVQSLVVEERSGLFTRLGVFLEEKFERR